MKILILCDHFGTGGGAGTIARLQAEELSKTHEVYVLTAHLPQNLDVTRYALLVTRYNLDYPPQLRNYLGLYHPKAISILRAFLTSHRFDLAITHNVHWNWSYSTLDALAAHDIKTIHVFHDVSSFTNNTKLCEITYDKRQTTNDKRSIVSSESSVVSRQSSVQYDFDYRYPEWKRIREWWGGIYNPFRQILIQKHLAKATKSVAVSHALAEALQQNNIRVDAVVHNGLSPLSTNHYPLTTIRGNSILMVGRLNMSKGFLQAVDCLEYLKNHYNLTPELRIAGNLGVTEDIGAQKILLRAKDKGISEQIKFLGWINKEQLQREFLSCGLVIVPSICFDSFPTVILEALQYGKPVVATIFGGAKEIVGHGSTGYIEDPFNVPAFAERVYELLADQQKAHRFGIAGFERLRTEFSLETQTKKLLSLVQ